jgi:hypothetical protein
MFGLAPSDSFVLTFIGVIYSQFELINKNCKRKLYFLLLLGTYKFNVHYGPFSKIADILPRGAQTNPFFLNLHSGGWNQGPLDTAAT